MWRLDRDDDDLEATDSDELRQAYDAAVESGEFDDEAQEWHRAAAAGIAARWAAD